MSELLTIRNQDGTSISSLTREHDVKLAFVRDPSTSILSLKIRGTKTAVAAAKEDVEQMLEVRSLSLCDDQITRLSMPYCQ